MHFKNLLIIILSFLLACTKNPGLRPWAENPWYWSYNGKPILLLGASDDDNLFQWPIP